MKPLLLAAVCLALLVTACADEPTSRNCGGKELYDFMAGGSVLTCTAPDSRLIGKWNEAGAACRSGYRGTAYSYVLTFYNANQYQNFTTEWLCLSVLDDFITDRNIYNQEYKIESGQLCNRLWDNRFSQWNCTAYNINGGALTIGSTTYNKR